MPEARRVEPAHGEHVYVHAIDIPVCQEFSEKHLSCIFDVAEVREHVPSETIPADTPGTSLYIIAEGHARMVVSSPNDYGALSAVLRLLRRGEIHGLVQALDGQPHFSSLEAITKTGVLIVSKESFYEELERHPETARELLTQLAGQVRTSSQWLLAQL